MPEHFRPNWDDYFMAIARIVATRSTCDRLRAGAVLVKNKRIIATGYNGSPPGHPHCDGERGHLMEEGHCVRTIHAEHNAILQAAVNHGQSTDGAALYTVYSVCIHCAKYVVAAGIKRVVIGKVYRNTGAVEYLREAGIEVEFYKPNREWNEMIQKIFENDVEEVMAKEGAVFLKEEAPKTELIFKQIY